MGAVGIMLPAATCILPWLTPAVAVGMALVQVAAIILHGIRGETNDTITLSLTLLAAALLILWGRTRRRAIAPRQPSERRRCARCRRPSDRIAGPQRESAGRDRG